MNSAKPLSHADYVRLLTKADADLAFARSMVRSLSDELTRLLAENARLKAERDVLRDRGNVGAG